MSEAERAESPRDQQRALRLWASDLFSKGGFDDGDVLGEWWWDTFDGPLPDEVDEHDVLIDLVQRLLLPVIKTAGHEVETYTVETIHNPIRAETVDGVPVPDDVVYGHKPAPVWTDGIYVEIQPATVHAIGTVG